MALRLDFEDDVNDQGRANGETLHALDQPDMAGLRAKDLDEQI